MAIFVDLSQTIISVAMQQLKGDYNVDLARAIVYQALVSYKKRFGAKYGDLILAVDSHGTRRYWRKEKYKWYNARRSNKFKDPKDAVKWEKIFAISNQIVAECKEFLTWKTVEFPGAEADDVIAVLAKAFATAGEDVMIISSDGDFCQLQKYPKVDQYSAIQKKHVRVDNALQFLHEKILTGDSGDDIPNILSPNNSFVEGIRQRAVTKAIREEWNTDPRDMNDKYKERIAENRELIDFEMIPEDIQKGILKAYEEAPHNGFQGLYKFFISARMTRILTDLDFFKVKTNNDRATDLYSNEDFFDGGTF